MSGPLDRNAPPIDVVRHEVPVDNETTGAKEETHTLTDMSAEYEFFTTAPMIVAGGFDRDPVVEFLKHHPPTSDDEQIITIDYTRPFFEGLGLGFLLATLVSWDHRLYAVRRDRWDLVRDLIAGIGWANQSLRMFTRSCFYELEIVDQTLLYKKGPVLSQLPMLTITVFAASSNRAFSYIQPAMNPPHDRPRLVHAEPKPDMILEADSVLGPPLSPETLSRSRRK